MGTKNDFFFVELCNRRKTVFTHTVLTSCLTLKEKGITPLPCLHLHPTSFIKIASNFLNYFLQCTYRWSRCIRFLWITARRKDTFYILFLNIQFPLPLTNLSWAWLVLFRATVALAPGGLVPRYIFPLSHSTHSTFPMQIWQRPAVHQKHYNRHSLLFSTQPPTHPGAWVSRGASLYDTVVLITNDAIPFSPPHHFRAPQARERMIRNADASLFLSMAT